MWHPGVQVPGHCGGRQDAWRHSVAAGIRVRPSPTVTAAPRRPLHRRPPQRSVRRDRAGCGGVSWAERSLGFAQLSEWSGAGGRLGPPAGSVIKEFNCPGSRTSKRSVYFFNSTKSVYQVTTVTSMSRQAPSLFGAASVPGSGCRAGNPGRAGCCRVAAV